MIIQSFSLYTQDFPAACLHHNNPFSLLYTKICQTPRCSSLLRIGYELGLITIISPTYLYCSPYFILMVATLQSCFIFTLYAFTLLIMANEGSSSAAPVLSSSSENMTSSFSLKDKEKLEGQSNFVRWRATMRKILDLEDHLEITVTEQIEPIGMNDKKVLKKRNFNASLLMQGTIVKEQQYLITNCVTSFDAWTNLHNPFDKQNTISSFYQIKAMHDLKHSDNTNIMEYI